jgi:hypothetical protein
MLSYIIGFICVGFFLGLILKEEVAMIAIVVISILWFFDSGFWAIPAFIELIIGYAIGNEIKERLS